MGQQVVVPSFGNLAETSLKHYLFKSNLQMFEF